MALLEQTVPSSVKKPPTDVAKAMIPPIDPKLGLQLRDELLQRMFPGESGVSALGWPQQFVMAVCERSG